MGLDGLSMGNLGLHKEVTSAQMANQAEQLANRESGFKVKDVVSIDKEAGIEVKEDGSNKNEFFEQNFKEDEDGVVREAAVEAGDAEQVVNITI